MICLMNTVDGRENDTKGEEEIWLCSIAGGGNRDLSSTSSMFIYCESKDRNHYSSVLTWRSSALPSMVCFSLSTSSAHCQFSWRQRCICTSGAVRWSVGVEHGRGNRYFFDNTTRLYTHLDFLRFQYLPKYFNKNWRRWPCRLRFLLQDLPPQHVHPTQSLIKLVVPNLDTIVNSYQRNPLINHSSPAIPPTYATSLRPNNSRSCTQQELTWLLARHHRNQSENK